MAQYIATEPIIDLCLASKWRPGPRVEMQWWKQEGLDLEDMCTTAQEEERAEREEEEMDRTEATIYDK